MKAAAFAAALAVLLAAPAKAHEFAAHSGLAVAHPWARATPASAKTGVVFMEIKSAARADDRLVAGRTKAAARVEIHRHVLENGIARMRPVASLPVPAGRSVVLEPSGHHLMLVGLAAPLKEGDTLPLTLIFEHAGEIEIEASIEPIGAMGPHGFDHQPGAASHTH